MDILRVLKPPQRSSKPHATVLAMALLLTGAAVVPASSGARSSAAGTGRSAGPSALQAPTAVVLRSFSARRTGARTVTLRWRTGAEAGLVGFDLFRRRGVRIVRLNKLSVPARNAPGGASYTYVDRFAGRGPAQYRLEAVELDGTRVWAGSVSVR